MTRAFILIASALCLAGCDVSPSSTATPTKNVQAQKAAAAANAISFTENAEINNIERRLRLTADPGLLGFIILLNNAGQPILYEGVKGKVTSGSKRLTDPQMRVKCDKGQSTGDCFVISPSDEGTYGSSGEYIFYWNTNDVYRQWSGAYLYSGQPFRLNVEPLAVAVQTTGGNAK
jgi:hypothetical protein